jgi:melibiase-like protein
VRVNSRVCAVLVAGGVLPLALPALPQEAGRIKVVRNDVLVVAFHENKGRFTAQHRPSGKVFVTDGRLTQAGGKAKVVPVADKTFGNGQAIDVSYPDGCRDRITLFPRLPFALFRSTRLNRGAEETLVNKWPVVSAGMDLGRAPEELRALGTGGLTAPDQKPGSYAFLAVADPETRGGVVGGWLTHDRGSGVVFADVEHGRVRLDARLDYGRLRIAPGRTAASETFALGWFADTRLGLEAWADAVAAVYAIKLQPEPTGYCTWYHARASDAKRLAKQTSFAAEKLAPYGLQVIQIDDGWQAGTRRNGPAKDFTSYRENGPYPAGMKATADDIKRHGLTPGLWFMPFAGDHLDPSFKDHAEWFVKRADGTPYETKWGGTCLDLTHPGARAHVRDVVRRIAHDWGYTYFKMDGLWTGTATKQMYVNSAYKEDGIGDAVFHNPDKTNVEAYRDGLKLVRETAGDGIFLLGCCIPQNMRSFGGAFGLVEAMRIGPDNGPRWNSLVRGPTYGSRTYFLNGRVWYNDPDPVYVRPEVPLAQARLICSWVAVSGQLNASSESYADLPADRLDLLRRTMPYHGLRPRPADLFDHDPPRLWLLTDERRQPRRDVVALYNWDADRPAEFDSPLDRLGLADERPYVAFDYWDNVLLPPLQGRLRLTVPKQSCRVLAVRPALDRPQVISTSRHVTQGMIDLVEEKWDAASRTLSGKSRVVGGDPYELRLVAASPERMWAAEACEVSAADKAAGVRTTVKQAEGLVRATIRSPASRDMNWSIRFR